MKLDVLGPSLLPPELTAFLRGRPNLIFPMEIFQEAKYMTNDCESITIRGTPNYRNSGPWYDCVLVTYENNDEEKSEFPFQVHALFTEPRRNKPSAVGLMGMYKINDAVLFFVSPLVK